MENSIRGLTILNIDSQIVQREFGSSGGNQDDEREIETFQAGKTIFGYPTPRQALRDGKYSGG